MIILYRTDYLNSRIVSEFEEALTKAIKSIDVPTVIAVDVDYSINGVLLYDEYCNLPSQ